MSLFSRVIKGYAKVFPATSKDQFHPTEVADTVFPTYEYPVRSQRMEELFKVGPVSSALSTTPALSIVGPGGPLDTNPGAGSKDLDEYFECPIALVRSSTASGAGQPFFAFLQDPSGGIWPLCVYQNLSSAGVGGTAIGPPENYAPVVGLFLNVATAYAGFHTQGPVLLPPLWTMTMKHPSGSPAAAVAYTLTAELYFLRRPIAEMPLWMPY